jgi:hypothetical protein
MIRFMTSSFERLREGLRIEFAGCVLIRDNARFSIAALISLTALYRGGVLWRG